MKFLVLCVVAFYAPQLLDVDGPPPRTTTLDRADPLPAETAPSVEPNEIDPYGDRPRDRRPSIRNRHHFRRIESMLQSLKARRQNRVDRRLDRGPRPRPRTQDQTQHPLPPAANAAPPPALRARKKWQAPQS